MFDFGIILWKITHSPDTYNKQQKIMIGSNHSSDTGNLGTSYILSLLTF